MLSTVDLTQYRLPPSAAHDCHFELKEKRGFLPDIDPIVNFHSEELRRLYLLSIAIPEMIKRRVVAPTLETLEKLPGLEVAVEENSVSMLMRINAMVQSLVHAYVIEKGGDREKNKDKVISIPHKIAHWATSVAHRIGNHPVQNYQTYILNNYKLKDPEKGFAMENIDPLVNYSGTDGEAWFIKFHVRIEHLASMPLFHADAIHKMLQSNTELTPEMQEDLVEHFNKIADGMTEIADFFVNMQLRLSGSNFFNIVRPFLKAWQGGVVYEHVDFYGDTPILWRGASGAQSSILPALDRVLQIPVSQLETMQDMVRYMPLSHQHFLSQLNQTDINLLKTIEGACNTKLYDAYQAAVDSVAYFRRSHYGHLITPYIIDNLLSQSKSEMLENLKAESLFQQLSDSDNEKLSTFGFELIKQFFMSIKQLIVEHDQGQLLEPESNHELTDVLLRVRTAILLNLESSSLCDLYDESSTVFISSLLNEQKQALALTIEKYGLSDSFSTEQIEIILSACFNSYEDTIHKSLGTGGSDFTYFLQKNIKENREMFSPKKQERAQPAISTPPRKKDCAQDTMSSSPGSVAGSPSSFFNRTDVTLSGMSSKASNTVPIVRRIA